MVGQSENPVAQESIEALLTYAHGTAHEKISRGIALAIAMMVYGKEESAGMFYYFLLFDKRIFLF